MSVSMKITLVSLKFVTKNVTHIRNILPTYASKTYLDCITGVPLATAQKRTKIL